MNIKRGIIPLMVVFLFVGCIFTTNIAPTDPKEMTAEQKVNFAWGMYKAQFNDYKSITSDPSTLTEDTKKILRKKKRVLRLAYTAIMTYRNVIVLNGTPTPEQESALMDFINQFAY